jgi:hypothetical protein
VVPLLRFRPLSRLPRRAAGAPLLPAPALARALARGRIWQIEGHRHAGLSLDFPPPMFLLVLDGPGAALWQAVPDAGRRRRRLVPRGTCSDAPRLPPRPCLALRRLLARILGPDGPRLRRRQAALLLDLAKATGSEDVCYVAGLRERPGQGVARFRPTGGEDVLLLGEPRRPVSAATLPPGLRNLLRQDPGEVADDLGLAPQLFLSARPADRSAHARLEAQERLARRYGQALLDLLTQTP